MSESELHNQGTCRDSGQSRPSSSAHIVQQPMMRAIAAGSLAMTLLAACNPIFNINIPPASTVSGDSPNPASPNPTPNPGPNPSPVASPTVSPSANPTGSPSPSASASAIGLLPVFATAKPISVIFGPTATPNPSASPVWTDAFPLGRKWVYKTTTDSTVVLLTGELTLEVIASTPNVDFTVRQTMKAAGLTTVQETVVRHHRENDTQYGDYEFRHLKREWYRLQQILNLDLSNTDTHAPENLAVPAGNFSTYLSVIETYPVQEGIEYNVANNVWVNEDKGLIKLTITNHNFHAAFGTFLPIHIIPGFPLNLPGISPNKQKTTTTWELQSISG